MDPTRMQELIEQHMTAEMAGDTAAAVAMYTDDVEHDTVGSPTGPLHGPAAAQEFYDRLIATLDAERMDLKREYLGEDFCVMEHECTGVVNGELMGIAGDGRQVKFRILHVWEFKDDRISRENVWLDGGTIAAQLAPVSS
jgi:ketosteroid isomerase-like protein